MIDRERVLEELALALEWCSEDDNPRGSVAVKIFAVRNALELLKEQEPVHVKKREFAHMWFWCCGSCGVAITEGDKFCRMCGQAVKWE